jgi:hypothetical protein
MKIKTETILSIGTAEVQQHTYTKGPDIGDYYYTVHKDGLFVKKLGNRLGNAALELCKNIAIKTH